VNAGDGSVVRPGTGGLSAAGPRARPAARARRQARVRGLLRRPRFRRPAGHPFRRRFHARAAGERAARAPRPLAQRGRVGEGLRALLREPRRAAHGRARARGNQASPLGLEAAARVARYAVFAGRREPLPRARPPPRRPGRDGAAAAAARHGPEGDRGDAGGARAARHGRDAHPPAARAFARGVAARLRRGPGPALDRGRVERDDRPRPELRAPRGGAALHRALRRHGASPSPASRGTLAAANGLLEDLATADGVPTRPGDPYVLPHGISDERRANALRAFLARNAVSMPSEARLADMSRQLFEAREDARVRIDHGRRVDRAAPRPGDSRARPRPFAALARRVGAPARGDGWAPTAVRCSSWRRWARASPGARSRRPTGTSPPARVARACASAPSARRAR